MKLAIDCIWFHTQQFPFILLAATPKNDVRMVVRALYSYLASGENQLTFHENDRIALVGERAKGKLILLFLRRIALQ